MTVIALLLALRRLTSHRFCEDVQSWRINTIKRTIFWPSRPQYASKTPRPNYASKFSTWHSTTVQAGELMPNGTEFKAHLRQNPPCDPFPHGSGCSQSGSDFSQGRLPSGFVETDGKPTHLVAEKLFAPSTPCSAPACMSLGDRMATFRKCR